VPVINRLIEPLSDRTGLRVLEECLMKAETDFKLRLRFAGAESGRLQGEAISSCAVSEVFEML
jgi:hypothetical protein